jgi:hypothetical protein
MTILLIVLLLLTPSQAERDQIDHLFTEANRAYQEGDYTAAVETYSTIMDRGVENVALYYNLGNAHFKLRHIGESILYYERAQRLAPRDTDIAHNLSIARLYVVDKVMMPESIFAVTWWNALQHLFSRTQWAVLALVFYVLFMALLIVRLLSVRPTVQRWCRGFLYPVVVLFFITAGVYGVRVYRDHTHREAVVMSEKVNVLSAPSQDSNPVFSLHEGVKVRLQDQSGSFFRISLPDGKVGWLASDHLTRI